MKKIIDQLFSTRMAGLYMLLFAIAIGAATFIENDFGTSSAQKMVFRAKWFEVLLLLFAISLVVNIIRFRMIQNKKWTILTFHAAIIIILIGAGITRYFSYEGMMHIREGEQSNEFLSSETYLQFEIEKDDKLYLFDKPFLFSSKGKNQWKESFQLGDDLLEVNVAGFIPNPGKIIQQSLEGGPIMKIVISSGSGREEYFLRQNDYVQLSGTYFNFGNPYRPNAVNIYYRNDSLVFNAPFELNQMVMATQATTDLPAKQNHMLMLRSLYSNSMINFVIPEFHPSGKLDLVSTARKLESNNYGAAYVKANVNGVEREAFAFGQKGVEGKPAAMDFGTMKLKVAYGSKKIKLPFAIQLHDFIMDRYPGTDNPSSYASEVTLHDPRKDIHMDYRIFMNNILDYGGYRFFQSSFDKDELGSYLSVNHDFWGTWVSYIGYFLLTLGMILTFFSKKSRFYAISSKLKSIRESKQVAAAVIVLVMAMMPSQVSADGSFIDFNDHAIPTAHAELFGKLLVQDHKGRIKPINTLSSEILRKIARKESLHGLTADQILLGMSAFPEDWSNLPLIKLGKNEEIRSILGVEGDYASYNAFFQADGSYKFKDLVRNAHGKKPIDRGTYEKELIKLDERLNICNMVFTNRFLRIYPLENDPNNTWVSPGNLSHKHDGDGTQTLIDKFFPAYRQTLWETTQTNDWILANELVTELGSYQKRIGASVIPNNLRIKLEMFLNKAHIFSRLGMYYGILGLGSLLLFFMSVFSRRFQNDNLLKILIGLLGFGFAFHTIGLAIRWYVSGHAPWSNGYESMIYIAFTTVLAGLIFARKSIGGIAATSFLASIILMVASLSYLDPEITPLVPVLKSYWLTIHVSLEAGSYGFLMLGAIIGILNLLLISFMTKSNQPRINRTVQEMTYISEMTLIGGLFMVSVGTYLGGIWANESWGRYWGWDAKETWALVTILVYAFILHMRFIPGLRGNYAFNVASLFGFASVIMTYFGVNYYLSGLHSYAAGDPIPIPTWVYYTAAAFLVVSLVAFWRKQVVGKLS
jgi:cytochrome c-type biogenesis protein CcsB